MGNRYLYQAENYNENLSQNVTKALASEYAKWASIAIAPGLPPIARGDVLTVQSYIRPRPNPDENKPGTIYEGASWLT